MQPPGLIALTFRPPNRGATNEDAVLAPSPRSVPDKRTLVIGAGRRNAGIHIPREALELIFEVRGGHAEREAEDDVLEPEYRRSMSLR
jgi:hypothetical protein